MSEEIKRRQFLATAILGISAAQTTPELPAEIQRKRVRTSCAAANYNYGHDTEQVQGRLLTAEAQEDQVVMNLETIRMVHGEPQEILPGQGIAKPAADSVYRNNLLPYTRSVNGSPRSILPSIQSTPQWNPSAGINSQPQLVRRKTFVPSALQLDVAFVRLDQVALALYETGHLACSGRIAHNGGQFLELQGAAVTFQVKVYGNNVNANFPPPNGPMIASWDRKCWVSFKSSPMEISLVNLEMDHRIRLKYDEITHMSVNLVYWRSR